MKVLFVCSMNQWRSPTAERIYADSPSVSVRSCGTSSKARTTVNADVINWADLVLVMEDSHKRRLKAGYPEEMKRKKVHVLHIPDDYKYMDPELISELKLAVDPILMDGSQ